MKKIITAVIIFVAIVGACVIALKNRDFGGWSSVEKYTSEVYGYSFSYPEDFELKEYGPQFVSIGSSNADGYVSNVDISVFIEQDKEGYADFQTFVHQQAMLLCAGDNAETSVVCDKVITDEVFSTTGFVEGRKLDLNYVTRNVSQEDDSKLVVEKTFGPVFVFDITENVEGAVFAALLVSPSPLLLEASSTDAIDEKILSQIAGTLRFKKIPSDVVATSTDSDDDDETPTEPDDGRVRAPEQVVMSIGEEKEAAGLGIKINKLLMDNRCPIDVICITGGTVEVEATFSNGGESEVAKLSLSEKPVEILGYRITMQKAEPTRYAQKEIKDSDYRLTLYVEPLAKGDNI